MAVIKNITRTRLGGLVVVLLLLTAAIGNFTAALQRQNNALVSAALDNETITRAQADQLRDNPLLDESLKIRAMMQAGRKAGLLDNYFTLKDVAPWQQAALAVRPADPYGWLRLAFIRRVTSGDRDAALQALLLSLATAPADPRLALQQAYYWTRWQDAQAVASAASLQAQEKKLWQFAYKSDKAGTVKQAQRQNIVDTVDAALYGSADYKSWRKAINRADP